MKKTIIMIILLTLITTSFGTLTDDLVAYYKFDGNTIDATGNGYDGTNYGAIQTNGKIDNAYYFNGADNYIKTLNFNLKNGTSINFWYKTNSFKPTSRFFNKGSTSSAATNDIVFTVDNNQKYDLLLGSKQTNSYSRFKGGNLKYDNLWHQITIIINNITDVKIYEDANLIILNTFIAEEPINFINTNNKLWLGGDDYFSNLFFNGKVDEFSIWQKALTSQEVEELYNNAKGLQYPFIEMGNNLTIGEANLIIDEVFEDEFTNPVITNNQVLYTSFEDDLTIQRTYNRYIEANNKRFAIYYGENPSTKISQDGVFYTFETNYLTESKLRIQLQDFINNS